MVAERAEILDALQAIGSLEDDTIDIAEAALLLAALDRPDATLAPYRRHLTELAEEARQATSRTSSVDMQIRALTRVLVESRDYRGDAETYDDMRNANLIDVIDRRRGLPVALGILWLHAGRAYGTDLVGLAFPSHFLLRLGARGQRLIVDPFGGGRQMGAENLRELLKQLHGADKEIDPSHYAPVSTRDVLIRLQNNIKVRAVAAGELPRALDVLHAMTLIAPARGELWWETAMLHSRLGNLKTAISTLEGFLARPSAETGRDEIEDLLRRLRSRVN